MRTIEKVICKSCLGKKYNSVYQWGVGWFTDFGRLEYITVEKPWVKNKVCPKCNWLWFIEVVVDEQSK